MYVIDGTCPGWHDAHLLSDSPSTSCPFTHSLHISHLVSTIFSALRPLCSSSFYLEYNNLWYHPNKIIFQQNCNYSFPASFKFCSVLSLQNISCPSNLCPSILFLLSYFLFSSTYHFLLLTQLTHSLSQNGSTPKAEILICFSPCSDAVL